jgi:hypothetical protein
VPPTTIVVRLDARTRAALAAAARRQRETLSDATRRAILLLVEEDRGARRANPYLEIADLVGIATLPGRRSPAPPRRPRRRKRTRKDRGRP